MTREDVLDAIALDAALNKDMKRAAAIRDERLHIRKDESVREAALQYILEAAAALNRLPDDFFEKKRAERMMALRDIDTKTVLGRLVASSLSTGSYASNMRRLISLAKAFGDVQVTTVQSSIVLDQDAKSNIEKAYATKSSNTLLLFQTRPSLLGGMRIFRDGNMIDRSVRGKITQTFNQIKHV